MTSYSVHLESPAVPPAYRIGAEVRFAKSIERALGGPAAVVEAYTAWLAATENPPEEVSSEDQDRAKRWMRASDAARQAGLQELGEGDGAFFEVKLLARSSEDNE